MTLYFTNESGDGLTAEQRNIYYSTNVPLERVVVEQLVKGPAQAGHYAVLPPELKILSVTVSEGICYVNFDETFVNPPLDIEPEITIYAIANSLAETCHVEQGAVFRQRKKRCTLPRYAMESGAGCMTAKTAG